MALKRKRTSKAKNPHRDLEHKHQCAFFAAISHVNHPAVQLTLAIPNGFLRTKSARLRASKEGMRRGCSDTLCAYPSPIGPYHGLWLELKIKPNSPSPEQLTWLQRAREAGYAAQVVWSWDEMFRVWCEYLGIRVEVG